MDLRLTKSERQRIFGRLVKWRGCVLWFDVRDSYTIQKRLPGDEVTKPYNIHQILYALRGHDPKGVSFRSCSNHTHCVLARERHVVCRKDGTFAYPTNPLPSKITEEDERDIAKYLSAGVSLSLLKLWYRQSDTIKLKEIRKTMRTPRKSPPPNQCSPHRIPGL